MRLDELVAAEGCAPADVRSTAAVHATGVPSSTAASVEISSLAYDSRQVQPGALFFCVPGLQSDGHDHAPQAIAAGAVALVAERPLGLGVPELLVRSTRRAMGPLAAHFYGHPTSELSVVGITGTNGKTTTAYLVRALLEAGGRPCGLLGTVKSVIAGVERPAARTTPEAIDLQADFRAMLAGGEQGCAMEVSSHALALGRVDAVHFSATIFTNLTQDHLDFHDTMEDYFQAKRLLFVSEPAGSPAGIPIVNIDDPYGQRLAAELDRPLTFALDADADYCARDVHVDLVSSRFQLHTPTAVRSVTLPQPGRFNVSNALAALAAAHSLEGDLDTLVGALERGVRVPGRVEPVDEGQDFAVLVDYAHTPDSLQNVLRAAREAGHGRVICVFGAGGDRDRGKRPLMGQIAAHLSDVVLVTSDNPRSEDPEAIIAEIMAGIDTGPAGGDAKLVRSEVNRRSAIEQAVALAQAGDVLVIAGKGHEQGQELAGGVKVPFDDVTVAREALGARVGG